MGRSLRELLAASAQTVNDCRLKVPKRELVSLGSEVGVGMMLVQVKQVGGAAGSATAQCSFTYDVWAWDGDSSDDGQRIAEAIQPEAGRMIVGKYSVPSGITFGYARPYVSTDGGGLLQVPAEQPDPSGCEVDP